MYLVALYYTERERDSRKLLERNITTEVKGKWEIKLAPRDFLKECVTIRNQHEEGDQVNEGGSKRRRRHLIAIPSSSFSFRLLLLLLLLFLLFNAPVIDKPKCKYTKLAEKGMVGMADYSSSKFMYNQKDDVGISRSN